MSLHLQPEHAGLWCSEDLHIITIKSLVPAFFVKLELGCGERGEEAGEGGLWWRGNLAAPHRASALMQVKCWLLSVAVCVFITWR